MRDLSERLRDWDAGVRRLAEQAEARVADADDLVRDLYRAGRVRVRVLLGPVMIVRPYDPGCGPEDSGQVTQTMLLVPDGPGWCSETPRTCTSSRPDRGAKPTGCSPAAARPFNARRFPGRSGETPSAAV
jgi:hypothetical protein